LSAALAWHDSIDGYASSDEDIWEEMETQVGLKRAGQKQSAGVVKKYKANDE
jgi:hypothetical protein